MLSCVGDAQIDNTIDNTYDFIEPYMNNSQHPQPDGVFAITQEDQLRAGTYALLAALLRTVPERAVLERLLAIEASETEATTEISQAWLGLRQAAQNVDPAALDDEFHTLFIGVGRGELVPFGSWYITGFLMERPLSAVRTELAHLGYQRQSQVHEPEDHIAALCEVMALIIQDPELLLTDQRRFFEAHLAPWAETFFMDLEKAKAADFFRSVGLLGKAFIRLEKRYLEMPV